MNLSLLNKKQLKKKLNKLMEEVACHLKSEPDIDKFLDETNLFDDWEDWDAPPPPDEDGDSEFVAYDKAPLPKSGKSIFDNLEYPKLAIEMKLEGKVFIKFFASFNRFFDCNYSIENLSK